MFCQDNAYKQKPTPFKGGSMSRQAVDRLDKGLKENVRWRKVKEKEIKILKEKSQLKLNRWF